MIGIPTMNLHGHAMIRAGDLWASRAPFTNIDWQSNAARLQADHRKYGVLERKRVGGDLRYSLHYHSSLATLRDQFGVDRVADDFSGSSVIYNFGYTVAAFEFFVLHWLEADRLTHPVTVGTPFHAQGMCLAIGADLMSGDQYEFVVKGPEGNREHATPNGKLFGPDGEEYVHSSIKTRKTGTADVEDPSRPDGPWRTRDYTGNVGKWMKPEEEFQIGFRGGSWKNDEPWYFEATGSFLLGRPEYNDDEIGFLAAWPAGDSK